MRKIVLALLAIGFSLVGSAQTYGAWNLSKNIDLITDENTSIIMTPATDYPSLARYSALAVRCTSSSYQTTGVEVFFATDKYLGLDDYYTVIYRVDRSEPVTGSWHSSTSNEAVFIPQSLQRDFLSAIKGGSELIIRVSAYRQDYTYVVPINGFNDALYALGCYEGPAL